MKLFLLASMLLSANAFAAPTVTEELGCLRIDVAIKAHDTEETRAQAYEAVVSELSKMNLAADRVIIKNPNGPGQFNENIMIMVGKNGKNNFYSDTKDLEKILENSELKNYSLSFLKSRVSGRMCAKHFKSAREAFDSFFTTSTSTDD
jgi:hypothetical protein